MTLFLFHSFYFLWILKLIVLQLLSARNLDEFDEHFIASYGYGSLAEYRTESSPAHVIEHIHIPTLAINAIDDPVCSIAGAPRVMKRPLRRENDSTESGGGGGGLVLMRTQYGGHLGFPVSRVRHPCGLQSTWTDSVVLDWLAHF